MGLLYVLTHPNVLIEPNVPVPMWHLSDVGRARMQHLLAKPWIRSLTAIYSSAEQKALDTAEIVARHVSLPIGVREELGENDRSATGFLPPAEFEVVAREMFANPQRSVRGWETAEHAQQRFIGAVNQILAAHDLDDTLLIACHGGVASLYLAHLIGAATALDLQQPEKGGGNYFCVDIATRSLVHAWQIIDA